jgi:hypothetical protein
MNQDECKVPNTPPPEGRTVNPRRQAAGRLNRAKRPALTEEARRRLRELALKGQPWRSSTGPRTAAGKARAARNGKVRQRGPDSVREARRLVADLLELFGPAPRSM